MRNVLAFGFLAQTAAAVALKGVESYQPYVNVLLQGASDVVVGFSTLVGKACLNWETFDAKALTPAFWSQFNGTIIAGAKDFTVQATRYINSTCSSTDVVQAIAYGSCLSPEDQKTLNAMMATIQPLLAASANTGGGSLKAGVYVAIAAGSFLGLAALIICCWCCNRTPNPGHSRMGMSSAYDVPHYQAIEGLSQPEVAAPNINSPINDAEAAAQKKRSIQEDAAVNNGLVPNNNNDFAYSSPGFRN